jgi:alpha-mannosidase
VTAGLPYPGAEFARAWQGVLFNQFHDIIAGTSIESAYTDARNLHGEALAIADRALTAATIALSWRVRILQEEGTTPLVVFNPHAWPARVKVETEFARLADEHGLLDDAGRAVPWQPVQSESITRGRSRLAFVADLPPLGYRTYRVIKGAAPLPPPATVATDTFLENEYLRLTFDPATGYITSLFDKRHELEALAGAAAVPVVLRDESDTWSHNVFSFRDEIGRFTATSVRLVAHGPVESVIRVTSEYGDSRLVQDFALRPDSDLVEVSATVDWREQFKALKLRFPIHVHFHRATAEIPYGSIDRVANGEEEPGQGWVDLSGTSRVTGARYGVSIINDGKYSYDVNIRDIGLTILRSPIHAHHDPSVPEPGALYTYIDQGVQRFRYAIYPHAGGWEEAGTVRRAAEFNQVPHTLLATCHPDGVLPQAAAFATAEPANVVITALKQAEDGDDLILRAHECTRTATRAELRLPMWGRTIAADFGPSEIKTFRVPRDPSVPATEVNLIEWGD